VRYDPPTMDSLEALVEELSTAIGRGSRLDRVPELPPAVRERLAAAPAGLVEHLIEHIDSVEAPSINDEDLARRVELLGGLGNAAGLVPLLRLAMRLCDSDPDNFCEATWIALCRATEELLPGHIDDAIEFCARHRAHNGRALLLLVDCDVVDDRLLKLLIDTLPRSPAMTSMALGLYEDVRAIPHIAAGLAGLDRTAPEWEMDARYIVSVLRSLGAELSDDQLAIEAEAERILDDKRAQAQRRYDEEHREERELQKARADARRPDLAPDRLRELAVHPDWEVRWQVARQVVDPEVLTVLAEDASARIRVVVAWNPYAPRLVLERLLADPAPEVRGAVASNPQVRVTDLERLARDPDAQVRGSVACQITLPHHPGVPVELALRLSTDPDATVRRQLLLGDTPPWLVERLAKDPDPELRRAAAKRLAPERRSAVEGVLIRPHQLADGEVVFEAVSPTPVPTPPRTSLDDESR
jgi:hypothetical protein